MSLHRTKATFIGLLEAGRVNEWVVTEKLGDVKSKLGGKTLKKPRIRIGERYVLVQCSRLIVPERFRVQIPLTLFDSEQGACARAWCWGLPLPLWLL